ncbi:uncharacterized protein B0P05DRAFT_588699 [Gilbertella persicaria]|uniref:uncharacterized protein n=1 Tax=Gilbertella persicaria TaxID=101096 RepID=UPI00221FD7CC|nr:uncharacterized protein B0P05DRAFT_588699 [Gilbertella persicaria]KAI8073415.1 hypothetical protein B0P05DRAFT_588699 [Gilbertella persicaria]
MAKESSSSLIHRLHTNESQLRTLAVVLSLTGGLSLSFALGVGILIYWYSRKCKQRRNTKRPLTSTIPFPSPPVSSLMIPEPSAPSAKDIDHTLCHDCLIPPPAYTQTTF